MAASAPTFLTTRRALPALLVLAGILRLISAHNDLWLDELMSRRMVQDSHQFSDLFTRFVYDNNHFLNTVWMYLVGPDAPVLFIRGAALFWSIATVAAAWWVAAPWTPRARFLFAFLLAINYPVIQLTTEARGYAGALCLSLVAIAAARGATDRPAPHFYAIFASSCILGFLSHLTFLSVWAAIGLWAFVRDLSTFRWRSSIVRALKLHAAPLLALALFYFACLHHMHVFSNTVYPYSWVLRRYFALTLGWPWADPWSFFFPLLLFAGIAIVWARTCIRLRDPDAILVAAAILLPLLALLIVRPQYTFPRYFLLMSPFLCWILAQAFDALLSTRAGRSWAGIVLALTIAGHVVLLVRFWQIGRGNPSAVARYLAEQTPGEVIPVAPFQPFRSAIEFPYLQTFLPDDKRIMNTHDPGADRQALWYLIGVEGSFPPPGDTLRSQDGDTWRLVASYPSPELSGEAFYLYRRIPSAIIPSMPAPSSRPSIPQLPH